MLNCVQLQNFLSFQLQNLFFFQVDPERFAPESLTSFGIEVISEEEDGYLIGATADLNLVSLTEKNRAVPF
jgi:hypothetical protein